MRLQTLREAALIGSAAALLGVVNVRWRDVPLDWIAAPKPLETSCAAPSAPVVESQRITLAAAKSLIGRPDVTWVDARSGLHYARSHVPGAVSLPVETAAELLTVQSLPIAPDNMVVTYCDGGPCELSEALADLLTAQAGCSSVRVLDGGFQAWVQAGLPITSNAPVAQPHDLQPDSEAGAMARLGEAQGNEETPR